jgi:FKBP-type peptidyl-prolyl cis-trans isomerase
MVKYNAMYLRYIILILISVATYSCGTNSEKPVAGKKPGTDEMADLNRYLVRKDRELIQNYAERKKLTMSESPTGLWYQVINEGEGTFYRDNDKIRFDYECSLLDGTRCYSSKSLGPKEVIMGRSGLEAGLNEGLRMLKPGGEAIFILPPFLAYGLPGDGKMIPSRAVIVYNVHILRTE